MIGSNNLTANCWEEAGKRYNVNPWLLYSIAQQESSLKPNARNANSNGTYDLGLMQINSIWFKELKEKYGISEKQLLDPCVSIHIGAWILAQNIARHGSTWEAVGAYNAGSSKRTKRIRYEYAKAIQNRFHANAALSGGLRKSSKQTTAPATQFAKGGERQ
ncbi:MAG: lytic transglycosylase domain-containing protein [Pseudobdellovibrionaceae bacterium]|nr:lytic transglycosylase domain-containing protein [Pseudobdellovibrionaceae bacterium]